MEIKDLLGLKDPLMKLIEVVSSAIGVLYEPTHIKRKAIAEGQALKIKSQAVEEALKSNPDATALALICDNEELTFEDVSTIVDRANARLGFQSISEQKNIENVIAGAVKYLKETVSEDPVDPDWRSRFFDKIKSVSHEDMQEVWSKVLAGEVSAPGTYSLRSLELLSNLTHIEAEIFRQFSSFIEVDTGFAFLTHGNVGARGFNSQFNFATILRLQDCGLLMPKENLGVNQYLKVGESVGFRYRHGVLILQNKLSRDLKFRLDILSLTASGKELLSLIDPVPWSDSYLLDLRTKYPEIEIHYSITEKDT